MRTKEALDREAKEEQERTWIYLLHQQNPPLTRRPTPPAPGFIPLAPMTSAAPLTTPDATRSAAPAGWRRLQVQVGSIATPTQPSPHTPGHSSNSNPWIASAAVAPVSTGHDHRVRPTSTLRSPYGGMVKLRSSPTAAGTMTSPRTPPFPLRSVVPSAMVPEMKVPPPQQQRTGPLVELLPKRRPRQDFEKTEQVDRGGDADKSPMNSSSGKRPCLPKKCDFPMCKNSSRSRGFCYSHGGGRRCRIDGCSNGAVSRDLCKRHGGGRRCRITGCKSSSESGGLCYSHGGGRRCSLSWCNARAKKGGYCAAHLENKNAPAPAAEELEDARQNEDEIESEATEDEPAPKRVKHHSVNPLVIETLLSLAKSPSTSEAEDNDAEPVQQSPTSPSSALLSPTGRLNAYALAAILN